MNPSDFPPRDEAARQIERADFSCYEPPGTWSRPNAKPAFVSTAKVGPRAGKNKDFTDPRAQSVSCFDECDEWPPAPRLGLEGTHKGRPATMPTLVVENGGLFGRPRAEGSLGAQSSAAGSRRGARPESGKAGSNGRSSLCNT